MQRETAVFVSLDGRYSGTPIVIVLHRRLKSPEDPRSEADKVRADALQLADVLRNFLEPQLFQALAANINKMAERERLAAVQQAFGDPDDPAEEYAERDY